MATERSIGRPDRRHIRHARQAQFEDRADRLERQERVTAWLDISLGALALLMLVLLVLEFSVSFGNPWDDFVIQGQIAIWVLFVLAFAFELIIAPSAMAYLRTNWLVAISLVIPALRVFRVLHAVRVLRGTRAIRSFQLVRTSTVLNRVARVIREFFQFSRFVYLVLLTVAVSVTSGVLVYWLEQGHPDATINSLGDGLWWAATTVTTINSPLEPVTWEARIIALVLRLFGLAVIGYLTAVIAVFLIGKRDSPDAPARHDEIGALRDEIARLRESIERRR